MSDNNRQGIHVLLVEDNPGDVRLLQELLRDGPSAAAFTLEHCADLEAGLERPDSVSPSIVLLDLGLPDSQGLDTFRLMRQRFPDVPIVVLSGETDEAVALGAVQEGAEDFLLKQDLNPRLLARTLRYSIERHELKEQLQYLATHDPLTGTYNRRYFNSSIEAELARSQRYSHPIGFLMIDVNRFKEINDRHGHQIGDAVLKQVAGFLVSQLRAVDLVVRYGGDEFLLVLPETNGEADEVAARLRRGSSELTQAHPALDAPITLSVGASHWDPQSSQSITEVLAEADERMYEDKRRRGQGVQEVD